MVKLSGLFVGFYKGLQPIRHDLSNLKRLSFTIIPRLIRRDLNLFSNCSKLEELTLRVKFEPYRREYFPHSHNVKKLSLKDDETFYRIKRAIHRLSEKYKTLDLTSCKKLKKLTITNGSHGLDLLLNENNVIEEFDITSSGWDHSFLSKMNHLTHLSLSGLGVGDISDLTSLKSLYLGYVYTDSEIFKNSSMMPQNLTHLTAENGDWNPEVFSLSFINNCKNLHSLEITISRTTVDLTSLEIFPNLTELNLALKNLSYIPVDRFPSLVSLIIRTQSKELCNNIAKDFPHLENLLIYNCYLQDLICIKNSQSLRLLELWDSDYLS